MKRPEAIMERAGTHEQEKATVARRLGLDSPSLRVESTSFGNGQPIPEKHAGGRGRSPALKWSQPPPETREIVVLCEDPDAPRPQPFVHWIITGLPPDTVELP